MSHILSLLCCCCPFFRKKRKHRKRKTVRTSGKNNGSKEMVINSEQWEKNSLVIPNQIKEKDLTQIFVIPNQYNSLEECMSGQDIEFYESDLLGEGSYGSVYRALDKQRGVEIACKQIELSSNNLKRSGPKFNALRSELFVLTKARGHPNLIQLFKHFIVEDLNKVKQHCYVFMELANGGSLLNKMTARNQLTGETTLKRLIESLAKNYFKQIVEGLMFLHSKGIAHKDLKLSNILIVIEMNEEVIKISDFGVSRVRLDPRTMTMIRDVKSGYGTAEFMSPQLLKLHIHDHFGPKVGTLRQYDSFKADCWALGVLLYVMICGSYPFKFEESEEVYVNIYNTMKKKTNRYELSEFTTSHYSANCLALIEELIEPDVCKRLDIKLVKENPWLTRE